MAVKKTPKKSQFKSPVDPIYWKQCEVSKPEKGPTAAKGGLNLCSPEGSITDLFRKAVTATKFKKGHRKSEKLTGRWRQTGRKSAGIDKTESDEEGRTVLNPLNEQEERNLAEKKLLVIRIETKTKDWLDDRLNDYHKDEVTNYYLKQQSDKVSKDSLRIKRQRVDDLEKLRSDFAAAKARWTEMHQERVKLVWTAMKKEKSKHVLGYLETKLARNAPLKAKLAAVYEEMQQWEAVKQRWSDMLETKISRRQKLHIGLRELDPPGFHLILRFRCWMFQRTSWWNEPHLWGKS
ncbi:hypothetical protein BV898_09796 [Hypsibius exemplaris]|uniref:Uncharacterized protein n=1 Tax=Hypsibius exemplaris TaxID=2072580 RepID=A0A1W0WLE9_HYPEX|nr:hypothetical protein BV898_09796 [Hypsibius exemplaris]